jgi:hypothetical protein
MPFEIESDYFNESDISHILIERTKCLNLKTIKYSIFLKKTNDYSLNYINKVFVKFVKKYIEKNFKGSFVGSIKLFDNSYKIIECNLTKANYIRDMLNADDNFFIFKKYACLELIFNSFYNNQDNDWYMDNITPLIFEKQVWTMNEINYY